MALRERTTSREYREEQIAALRKRGWTYDRIAARVGMTRSGVAHALKRMNRRGG